MEIFQNIDLNKIGSIASIVVGIPTVLYWLIIAINNWILLLRSKNVKKGIYQAFWHDPKNKNINCEILSLKRTYRGFKASPIYIHKASHNYKLICVPFAANKFIFKGFWKAKNKDTYKGPALFHLDHEANILSGKWLGPRRTGEINGGDWILKFYKEEKRNYFTSALTRRLTSFKENFFTKQSLIENIIKKHDTYNSEICIVDNIDLKLNSDSFIPELGKISIPMIKYVSSIVKDSDKILDLGTGTGFYPIYLAKNNNCEVVGVDITTNSINLAENNSLLNNVSYLTSYRLCEPTDLFSRIDKNERFDYIIANLPFSRKELTSRSKKSKHYYSFSGSRELLANLVLGSQFHIKPNGKLIFCFGESGYKEYLETLIDFSSWKYLKIIQSIKYKDDTFYIYELELSDFVKDAYSKLK